MQNPEPYVSIMIPAFNSGLTLGRTIEACLKQGYPEDKLEVIVVDDGSGDDTKAVVERFGVRYIYQGKTGPASARNNGWRNSKGDAICFTDADCVPEPDWVSKLVRHYSMNDMGAAAGSYSVHGSPYLLDKFVHYEIKNRHSGMGEYVHSFGTYNVMVKRSVLEATGGFDSGYCNASGEDTDLSYRIVKAGYKIYFERDALVSHNNILKFWKYFTVQFRHGYWRMKLYRGNSAMIAIDEYAYWKDFLEVFLTMAAVFSLFFNFQHKGALMAALFIIQIPVAVKIAFEGKNILYIFFSFITFIRAFVRIAGGMLGFIKFWIFRMG